MTCYWFILLQLTSHFLKFPFFRLGFHDHHYICGRTDLATKMATTWGQNVNIFGMFLKSKPFWLSYLFRSKHRVLVSVISGWTLNFCGCWFIVSSGSWNTKVTDDAGTRWNAGISLSMNMWGCLLLWDIIKFSGFIDEERVIYQTSYVVLHCSKSLTNLAL